MPGTCVNHTAGSDPELGCANFECNGAGACATTCGGGTCTSTACKPAAYCNGTTCLADKVDGLPCALACECASGVCASYYPDTDGDGQGNNSVSPTLYCGSAAPPGYTADNRDCCDTDNNAFVGQNMYFTSPRSTCGGGFDYNCVGGATSQYTAIQRCDNVGSNCLNRCTAAVTGWVGSAAACGATAAWGGCDYFEGCAPLQVCAATTTPMMQTQGCR